MSRQLWDKTFFSSYKGDLYVRVLDLQAALGQNPPSFDIKLSKLKGLKPPGNPEVVFRPFSKFRIVYKEGIEISRQFWNRISPFFLNTLVCRGYSNLKATLEGPTVSFVHVEVGCRICPSTHCSVLPLVPLCRFARPKIFTETHAARFILNGCYRLFSYIVREFYGQQGFHVLLGTRTHLSTLKK